jgi:hypothetical protein
MLRRKSWRTLFDEPGIPLAKLTAMLAAAPARQHGEAVLRIRHADGQQVGGIRRGRRGERLPMPTSQRACADVPTVHEQDLRPIVAVENVAEQALEDRQEPGARASLARCDSDRGDCDRRPH